MTQIQVESIEMKSPAPSARSVRIAHVVCLCALCVLLAYLLSTDNVADVDLYHQMALFRAALQKGWIPFEDLFAYTSDAHPSVHYEWGNGAVAYAITSVFGGTGLLALKHLLFASVGFFGVRAARQRGAQWGMICAMAPVAIVLLLMASSPVRAGLFTLLFIVVLLNLLAADRHGNRWWVLAWLPMYVIWLNIHPGFIVGTALIALHWLENLIRYRKPQWHLVALGLVMPALVLVNPYGVLYPKAIWHAITVPLPSIAEWQPMWRIPNPILQIVYAVSLIVALYAALRAGWRRIEGVLLVLVCAVAAFQHVRHCYLYAAAWFCYGPGWMRHTPLGDALERVWMGRPRTVGAASLVLLLFFLPKLILQRPWELRVPTMPDDPSLKILDLLYPAGAVQYLKEAHFQGNVMTDYNYGSYVMWHLWPAVKIGLDSRNDVGYSYPLIKEILSFYDGGEGWRRTLERFPTDLVLVRRSYRLTPLMERQSGWRLVYRDDAFELFARPGLDLPVVDRTGQRITTSFP